MLYACFVLRVLVPGTRYQVLPGYHVPVLLSCILALPVRPLVAVAVLVYQLRYQGTRSIWYWYQAPGNNAGSKSGVTTEELPYLVPGTSTRTSSGYV